MALKSNFNQFFKETQKAIEKELEKQQSEGKKIVLEAHQLIIKFSPVSTGYFRANNFLTVNQPTPKTLLSEDEISDVKNFYSGAANELVAGVQDRVGGLNLFKTNKIFIQNNLKYADALESGHSKLATGTAAIYGRTEQIIKGRLDKKIK